VTGRDDPPDARPAQLGRVGLDLIHRSPAEPVDVVHDHGLGSQGLGFGQHPLEVGAGVAPLPSRNAFVHEPTENLEPASLGQLGAFSFLLANGLLLAFLAVGFFAFGGLAQVAERRNQPRSRFPLRSHSRTPFVPNP